MDNMAIIVRNVTKKFGNVTVLDNVSLQVKRERYVELLEEMDQAKPFYSNVSVDCFRLMKDRSWWIKKRLEQSLKNQDFSSSIQESRILDYLHQCREKKI